MTAIVERAWAKVNLALHVTGRRDDGFHELESLVAFTEFGDTVTASMADDDDVVVTGPTATMLSGPGGENIVADARDALRALTRSSTPVSIEIEKRIPVAAGLGGGSADAAGTLRALARLWRLAMDDAALCEAGLPLGADVPMCVLSRTLVARGIGERLVPVRDAGLERFHVLLVNPTMGGGTVPTAKVFAALAEPENPPLPERDGDTLGWLQGCRNDLTAPALTVEPAIEDVLGALDDAMLARMSGSGATCFGLYDTAQGAATAEERIRASRPDWFVVRTRFIGSGGE